MAILYKNVYIIIKHLIAYLSDLIINSNKNTTSILLKMLNYY